jgi:hypothetical protein
MAGNANSGNRQGSKSITHRMRKAIERAIKQGDAGVNGQRALSDLTAELMQTDVLAFYNVVAKYCPQEIIIDQSISITHALADARSRIIDITPQNQSLTHDVSDALPIEHHQSALCDALNLEGEGEGGVGAGSVRGSSS